MGAWGSHALRVILVVAACAVGLACARNHAPPSAIASRHEGPIGSRDIVEGGRIYMTLCAACHRGRVNPRGYRWTPGQMRHQIREGNRLMPPLGQEVLRDEQVEAVLAYLQVMGALEGELPPDPDSTWARRYQPRGGDEPYDEDEDCAVQDCEDGEGDGDAGVSEDTEPAVRADGGTSADAGVGEAGVGDGGVADAGLGDAGVGDAGADSAEGAGASENVESGEGLDRPRR